MTISSMWPNLERFDDIEAAVMDLIAANFPELADTPSDPSLFHVGRVWPADVYASLPVVRVSGIGGHDDRWTDRPLIDIDVLHRSHAEARDLARAIQALFLGYPHRVGSTVIDRVATAMRPHDTPWDDERVARYYASYQFSARR